MRVLLDHPNPFLLAHGGFQIQIEQIFRALKEVGVDADFLRWWDDTQSADVIHYFGRPPMAYLSAAHKKGIKVVLNQLLTGLGSRKPLVIQAEKAAINLGRYLLPPMLSNRFAWDSFRHSDACIANTEWEAHLMRHVFGASPDNVHVVPNGVEEVFLRSSASPRGQWLICTAIITERKRVFELAQAAVLARTPLWIIGKPYASSDPYAEQFTRLVGTNRELLRFEGAISDRAQLAKAYREARGFVLLSTMETRSLAAEEAAACECPLLLSDLPWANSVFGPHAAYCPIASPPRTASYLRAFYDAAPSVIPAPKPLSWPEVGRQFAAVYSRLLKTSR
jgi:glycosyltransferase involved in cell wall biosynthesis